RSQNITLSWRRSASAGGRASASGCAGDDARASLSRTAFSSFRRAPNGIPSFSRSASVSSPRISMSTSFSASVWAYLPSPTPASHRAKSVAVAMTSPTMDGSSRPPYRLGLLLSSGRPQRGEFRHLIAAHSGQTVVELVPGLLGIDTDVPNDGDVL